MRFTRRSFVQSAIAGLLLPLVEPIVEPRIWALGAIPEPEPVRYTYMWTWDSAPNLTHYTVCAEPPHEDAVVAIGRYRGMDYDDLAYYVSRLLGEPSIHPAPPTKDWPWTLG